MAVITVRTGLSEGTSSLTGASSQTVPPTTGRDYIIISPVKDEELYIEKTLRAVVSQTVRPLRWIIVDDGSRDRTPAILGRYSKEHDWITVVTVDRDVQRWLGVAEISAFDRGYRVVQNIPHNFIVKLDCDLDLSPDYFERLIARFELDQNLGIASGIYLEERTGKWVPASMPPYHAAGASKVIRSECFRQIGGFILRPGWDTVDEIRARALGWKTLHYSDVVFYHLKPEGSASGSWRTALLWGHVDYVTGVSLPFFLLKAFHRMFAGKPLVVSGLGILSGFLRAFISRTPKLVSVPEARLYRQLLNQRVADGLRRLGGKVAKGFWVND